MLLPSSHEGASFIGIVESLVAIGTLPPLFFCDLVIVECYETHVHCSHVFIFITLLHGECLGLV